MKDKLMMMYDHIISSEDVESWAKEEFKRMLDVYLADGCQGCAFESAEEWEIPCSRCKRNCKDYWRKKEGF